MRPKLAAAFLSMLVPSIAADPVRAAAPADGWIVWQSTREDGRAEVYRARADGTEVLRLSREGGGRSLWSPDGRWVAFMDSVGVSHVVRPDGTGTRMIATGFPVTWLHDGGGLLVAEGADFALYDPETRDRQLMFSHGDFPAFAGTTFQPNSITHDNRYLLVGSHLFMNGYTGQNGSFRAGFAAVLVDLLAKDKVYFLGSGCWPFTPPSGDLVFHVCGEGCPSYPDIMRMDMKDLATRSSYQPEISHPDPDWGHEYNPRVSNDNQWISYMTSTGCHEGYDCDYEIFIHRLGAGVEDRQRVTTNPAFDGYPDMYVGPLWTPQPQPRLLLTPARHTIFALAGGAPGAMNGARAVKVKNQGGGMMGAHQAEVTAGADWLQVTTAADGFQVALRPDAALTRGRHEGAVTVTAEGLSAPTRFPVTLIADDSYPPGPDAAADAAGDGPDAGAAADAPAGGGRSPSDGTGCGCRVGAGAGTRAAPGMAVASASFLGLLVLVRRRRRPSRMVSTSHAGPVPGLESAPGTLLQPSETMVSGSAGYSAHSPARS
jgi:hypothetical protein